MTLTRIQRRMFFIATLAALALGIFQVAHAVGISPARISTNLLPDEREERTFYISRPDASIEEVYTVQTSADFIDLTSGDELVLPVGENVVSYDFSIDATGLDVGEYRGSIWFTPKDLEEEEGASVSFVIQINGDVTLNVVRRKRAPIQEFPEVKSQNLRVEKQDAQITVFTDLRNDSNIVAMETHYQISLADENGTVLQTKDGVLNQIDPRDVVPVVEVFDQLQPGKYRVIVTVSSVGQQEEARSSLGFRIRPAKEPLEMIAVIAAVLCMACGTTLIVFERKRRQKRSSKKHKKKS